MLTVYPLYKIKKAVCSLAVLSYLLCNPQIANCQQPGAERAFKKYSTKNGMLVNSVYSVKQSKSGLLWIGTPGGLQRFDGYNFDTWATPADDKHQAPIAVYDLLEDSKGNIWVFGLVKTHVFPAGSKKFHDVIADPAKKIFLPDAFIKPLMEANGRIWCYLQNTGIFGINQQNRMVDTFICFSSPIRYKIDPYSVLESCGSVDENGTAWIAGSDADSNTIIQFKPGEKIRQQRFPVKEYGAVKGFIPTGNHEFLFTSTTQTFLCMDGDYRHPVKILSRGNIPGNYNRIFCFEKLKVYNKGSIIFPGDTCIYEYIPATKTLQPYSTSLYSSVHFSRQLVFALREDANGNVWIGRDASDGLLVYYPSRLRFNFLKAPPEYFSLVYSLAVDKKGNVYAANYEKGINVFNKEGVWQKHIHLSQTEYGLPVSVRSMQFIDSNHLVMKSLYGVMMVLNTDNYSVQDIAPLMPTRVIANRNSFDAAFIKTASGALQFVHSNYLLEIKKTNNNFTIHILDSLLDQAAMTGLVTDKNGQLVIGTTDGCYVKKDNAWNRLDMPQQLVVKHLALHPDGNIWAATTSGIYVVKNYGVIKSFTTATGLLNDYVYGILFDKDGNTWYSSNYGIGCIRKNNEVSFYSEEDGLQGDEFDTQSYWKGDDGKLYFGGIKGVSSFYPEKVLQKEQDNKVVLSGLLVNGDNFPEQGRIDNISALGLPYDKNSLTVNFALSDFSDPSSNIYKIKIDPLDKDWINIKSLHSMRYLLQPGKYTLHIKGSSDGSNWSEELVLPITIHPAWWQAWWFKLLAVVLLTGVALTAARYYNKRKLRDQLQQMQLQQEVQKERERISRDLHDNIGAYSTALIANADNLEQELSDEISKLHVSNLKDNAKSILGFLRETIWLLNNKNLTVSAFAEGFTNYSSKIISNYPDIEIEFEENIENNKTITPSEGINLLRILQEVIQNIVKHAAATAITCSISSKEKIAIQITDNGSGFDSSIASFGNGLNNMKHRAAEINYSLEIKSKAAKGTTVTIREN